MDEDESCKRYAQTHSRLYVPDRLDYIDFKVLCCSFKTIGEILPWAFVLDDNRSIIQVMDMHYRPIVQSDGQKLRPAHPDSPLLSNDIEVLDPNHVYLRIENPAEWKLVKKLLRRLSTESEVLYRLWLAGGIATGLGQWEDMWREPELRYPLPGVSS